MNWLQNCANFSTLSIMKNKTISDLVLRHNRLKQQITDLQQIQQENREMMKRYESLEKLTTSGQNYLIFIKEVIFEKRMLLNALQKQCVKIKKKIKRINKEQNGK
jgi:hypothetical protein